LSSVDYHQKNPPAADTVPDAHGRGLPPSGGRAQGWVSLINNISFSYPIVITSGKKNIFPTSYPLPPTSYLVKTCECFRFQYGIPKGYQEPFEIH